MNCSSPDFQRFLVNRGTTIAGAVGNTSKFLALVRCVKFTELQAVVFRDVRLVRILEILEAPHESSEGLVLSVFQVVSHIPIRERNEESKVRPPTASSVLRPCPVSETVVSCFALVGQLAAWPYF